MNSKKHNKTNEEKNFINKEEKKSIIKILLIILPIIFLVIAISLIVYFTCFYENPLEKQRQELINTLEQTGKEFYENFYYPQLKSSGTVEEKKEFLSKFKTIGIKVDLANLSRFRESISSEEFLSQFVNQKTNKECDINKTQVIFYPKEDYNAKDYKMEVILICGFETLEELKIEAEEANIDGYEKMNEKEIKEALKNKEKLEKKAKEAGILDYEYMSDKELEEALKNN